MDQARLSALTIINNVVNVGNSLTVEYRKCTRSMNSQDASLIKELAYGTIRYKLYIDHLITEITGKHVSDMNKNIRNLVRMSVYQLKFMEKKEYAVVSESVNIVKKMSSKDTGFVNWILREYLRIILNQLNIMSRKEIIKLKFSKIVPGLYLITLGLILDLQPGEV